MAGAQPYWGQQIDMNNLFFGLDTDIMEHNHREHQQVSEGFENKFPHSPLYPGAQDLPTPRPHRDQVVPSFQRLSVYEGPQRRPKPLPPLPDPEAHSSDEAADDEVEFFTDDRRRLLPQSCPDNKALALRYGAPCRRSYRGCGQVNYAYHEGPAGASGGGGGGGGGARGWVGGGGTGGRVSDGASIEANGWAGCGNTTARVKIGASGYATVRTCGGPEREALEQQPQQQQAQFGQGVQAGGPSIRDVPGKQPDRPQRSRLRRSHSGPAGSFKPAGVRLGCHLLLHHHHHLLLHQPPHHHGSCRAYPQDKPEVPPRAPIPPRPSKAFAASDCPRWPVPDEDTDEDKPPAVPPREPLTPSVPPRTPSPRSLPIYVNGVMPPTQSFAPNPKYVVSRGVPQRQQQQQSDRAGAAPRPPPGPAAASPCIVPVMEDGRKASATHYFLLPRRPAYMDRLERFLSEADGEASGSACTSEWQKPPLPST